MEQLPVDAQMAALERELPILRQLRDETEADIDRLGSVEPAWTSSGISLATAIASQRGDPATHVLGEWERGGNSVYVSGDRPFELPPGMLRYAVSAHDGPIDQHHYFRIAPGLVIHTFGTADASPSALCRQRQGMELISRTAWREWPARLALTAFPMVQWTRDDVRVYCSLFRPVPGGGLTVASYTQGGRRYLVDQDEPQTWVLTSRTEASARLFVSGSEEPPGD